jgi:hypothetical protein
VGKYLCDETYKLKQTSVPRLVCIASPANRENRQIFAIEAAHAPMPNNEFHETISKPLGRVAPTLVNLTVC